MQDREEIIVCRKIYYANNNDDDNYDNDGVDVKDSVDLWIFGCI